MPQRQPKAAIARIENRLLQHYANAWQRCVDLQEAIANDPAQWRKARKLREAQTAIEREMAALDAYAQSWFAEDFPRVYSMGVGAGARELGVSTSEAFALINTDALEKLAADGFDDLLKATRLVRRTTKSLVRAVLSDAILDKTIRGETAVAAARRASRIIESKGIHAVRYSNGARHGLREYANMAVRTKTAVAYNVGSLDAGQSQDVVFWEVFDGICGWDGHDSGESANGKIVTRDEALAHPISHPNCRRSFGGRPDLSPQIPKELLPREPRRRAVA